MAMLEKCSTLLDQLGSLLDLLESSNYNADRDEDRAAALLTTIINSRGFFRENGTLVGYVREVENVAGSILKAYAPDDRPGELARLGEVYEAIREIRDTLVSPATASVTFTGPTQITGGVAGGNIGAINPSTPAAPLVSGLDPVDELLLSLITQEVLKMDRTFTWSVRMSDVLPLLQAQGIEEDAVEEAVATLEGLYLESSGYMDAPVTDLTVELTVVGFDYGIRRVRTDYDAFITRIARYLMDHPNSTSWDVAQALPASHMLVKHALHMLKLNGFIEITETSGSSFEMAGLIHVEGSISPKLRRLLRSAGDLP